ncbi:MAG: ribonuclease III domain-containing protein, partial [Rhodoglobus sp.]
MARPPGDADLPNVADATNDRSSLSEALGVQISDELLELALTHRSFAYENGGVAHNERLEFLGDRVLGLAIAELLIERDPKATEGALARRFNRLVRKEACARVGRVMELGGALLLS